jgi:P27 family predicted phage terminase small subunit
MRKKSPAIHQLQGTFRPDRQGTSPSPPPSLPVPGAHLNAAAKQEYDRAAAELFAQGTLANVDKGLLEAYATNYARWADAEKQIEASGAVIKAPSGYPVISPWVSIANGALKQMQSLAAALGMSPASRTRLTITEVPELPTDMELFLAHICVDSEGKYHDNGDGRELSLNEVRQRTSAPFVAKRNRRA